MPTAVADVDTLRDYISKVMDRAGHHAQNVQGVALALAGAIVWRKDVDAIEVMSQNGDLKNVLWVRISGQRYAFSFNHDTNAIEMRAGTTHGAVLNSFDDQTTALDVHNIFSSL